MTDRTEVEEIREALTNALPHLQHLVDLHVADARPEIAAIRNALVRIEGLEKQIAGAEERGRAAGYATGFRACADDAVAHLLDNEHGLMARDIRLSLHVGAAARAKEKKP